MTDTDNDKQISNFERPTIEEFATYNTTPADSRNEGASTDSGTAHGAPTNADMTDTHPPTDIVRSPSPKPEEPHTRLTSANLRAVMRCLADDCNYLAECYQKLNPSVDLEEALAHGDSQMLCNLANSIQSMTGLDYKTGALCSDHRDYLEVTHSDFHYCHCLMDIGTHRRHAAAAQLTGDDISWIDSMDVFPLWRLSPVNPGAGDKSSVWACSPKCVLDGIENGTYTLDSPVRFADRK